MRSQAQLHGEARIGARDAEEYAAAGRAILMLIDELERLRIELWRAREQLSRVPSVSANEAAESMAEQIASTLHQRPQGCLRATRTRLLRPDQSP